MKVPAFWFRPFGFCAAVLSPLSLLYRVATLVHRVLISTKSVDIPVICVGNVTVGGAGKTPCVAAIAKLLQQKGYSVHILSRGYGGSLKGPVQVDSKVHTAQLVGDEPLILANVAPTWIAKNRYHGAKAACKAGADIILMDDGLQNNELHKNFSILVMDQKLGYGNGMVLPAGPLREPMDVGINKADAIFITNPQKKMSFRQPTYPVITHVVQADIESLTDKSLFAFSGIAHPQKFYQALKALTLNVVGTKDFADHHVFSENELCELENEALKQNAMLVTTEKDWVRLTPGWRKRITFIRIENEIKAAQQFLAQLHPLIKGKAA